MFIQTEATPNPATLKFLPGRAVLDERHAGLPRTARPRRARRWPHACSTCPASTGVFFGSDFITVTKGDGEWQHLKPAILGAIMEHFMSGDAAARDGTARATTIATRRRVLRRGRRRDGRRPSRS